MCGSCTPDDLCDEAMGIFDDEESCFFCDKINCICDEEHDDYVSEEF
jgi:hypothetical protein